MLFMFNKNQMTFYSSVYIREGLKSDVTSHVTEEEARVLHNDCKGGNSKHFKPAHGTTKKFS